MLETQIVARLQVVHEAFAGLYLLTCAAQRKPSRQEALVNDELVKTFGANGLVLRKSTFANGSRAGVEHVVPGFVHAVTTVVFGDRGIVFEVLPAETPGDEFRLCLKACKIGRGQYANAVHDISALLQSIAKIDRYALHRCWQQQNPDEAERQSRRVSQYLNAALGIVGGYQRLLR